MKVKYFSIELTFSGTELSKHKQVLETFSSSHLEKLYDLLYVLHMAMLKKKEVYLKTREQLHLIELCCQKVH